MNVKNGTNCPCVNLDCPRFSKCEECVIFHRNEKNNLPSCLRGLFTDDLGRYGSTRRQHRISIKARADRGIVSFGMVVNIPSPVMAELAAIAGCDFIRVDMEHNLFTVEQVQHIVRAADGCGIATCIRLDEYSMITPMLDFGVEGFMFPHVRSAAQAKDLVERVKYAPTGRRGYADAGRAQRYGSMPFSDYMKEAQFDVFLQVQIEDREGLEHMEEIIATPGLDFICTGRGDIAQALGIPGYGNDAKVTEVENRIIDCASKHGLRCQLSVGASVEKAREFYKRGVRTFTIGDDRAYLLGALKENVDMFRAVMFKQ